MSVISNEVLRLLDHGYAEPIIKVVRCGLGVASPRRVHAMTLRFMVWHLVVHMMIVHATELLHATECHFAKREMSCARHTLDSLE